MERTQQFRNQTKRQELNQDPNRESDYDLDIDQGEDLGLDEEYGSDSMFEVEDEADPAEDRSLDYGLPEVSVAQIQELEKKLRAIKGSSEDKQLLEILKSLKTAEQSEIQAEHNEKFSDESHQEKARELKQIAADLFTKAAPQAELKFGEAANLETEAAAQAENRKLSDVLSAKLTKAAGKVGYVHYDLSQERNGWAIALSVLTIGAIGAFDYTDYRVKSKMDKAYTVGFSNVDLQEQAANMQGYADGSNASGGDHAHTKGDEIDFNKYRKLEEVQRQETGDVKAALIHIGSALKETDPAKQAGAWQGVIDEMDSWNTTNQDRATVYHRARLLFDTMMGEGGEGEIKQAIENKIIPKEFCDSLTAMLESLPTEEEVQATLDPKNVYHRGGTSDRNWSNSRCSEFIKMAADPNYAPLPEETSETSEEDVDSEKTDADASEKDKGEAA